jgi:hypothetical protein
VTLAVVELGQIVEVIWVSLLAGVGITAAFSMVVYGSARYDEARRAGQAGTAFAFALLALVFMVLFFGAVVLGVQIMLSKDV